MQRSETHQRIFDDDLTTAPLYGNVKIAKLPSMELQPVPMTSRGQRPERPVQAVLRVEPKAEFREPDRPSPRELVRARVMRRSLPPPHHRRRERRPLGD
jgi:hypothetical protein